AFTITVTDGDATDTAVVTVTVAGANDAPVIDSAGSGTVTEDDTVFEVTGTALASDVDGDDRTFSGDTSGTYGSFTIDDGGTWTYALSNADTDTNALDDGETVTDAFTITVTDGDV